MHPVIHDVCVYISTVKSFSVFGHEYEEIKIDKMSSGSGCPILVPQKNRAKSPGPPLPSCQQKSGGKEVLSVTKWG
jgi:hypothetical protein